MARSHYLNQSWLVVDWIFVNKSLNLSLKYVVIHENAIENAWNIVPISFWPDVLLLSVTVYGDVTAL